MSYYSNIIEQLQATTPELTNGSNASIFHRIVEAFAQALNTISLNISNSETVIENSARTLRVAGRQYYVDKSLAFQFGDNLVLIDQTNFQYGYAQIDASKQIIKQAAIYTTGNGAVINLNVCTQDDTGNIILTTAQLESFKSYMQQLSPLGIVLNIQSLTPATINCSTLYIRYLDSYSLTAIKTAVQQSLITTQLSTVGASPIYVNDMETNLKSISGVRDAYFDSPTCMGFAGTANQISYPLTYGYFTPESGYFNFATELLNLTTPNVQFIAVRQ